MNNKGSASVFLVFLFATLMGAVTVLLECSRYKGIESYAEDVTGAAAQSVMGEYYRPLYEEYHLLFLAYEDAAYAKKHIEDEAKKYMLYSLNPLQGIEEVSVKKKGFPFILPKLEEIEADSIVYATEGRGEIFEEEAVNYMKYRSVGKALQRLKGGLGSIKSLQSSAKILKNKMECEEKIQEAAWSKVELMRLIDGVNVTGITDGNAKIRAEDAFVKMFVIGPPSQEQVGIVNDEVWKKVKRKYVNVENLLREINEEGKEILKLQEQEGVLEREWQALKAKKIQNKEETNKKKEYDELEKKIGEVKKVIEERLSKEKEDCRRFSETLKKAERKTEEALKEIKNIKAGEKQVSEALNKYKTILMESKGKIESGLYNGLSDDLNEMNHAIGKSEDDMNYEEIEKQLKINLKILNAMHGYDNFTVTTQSNSLKLAQSLAVSYLDLVQEYKVNFIRFRYGEITKNAVKNPISSLKELVSSGIANLVLPEGEELSARALDERNIIFPDEVRAGKNILKDIMSNLNKTKRGSEIFNLFADNQGSVNLESVTDAISMLFYKQEHFCNFLERKEQSERCLFYEMEYILNGYEKDSDNMEASINKLMMCKTIGNFISIMMDSKKKGMAKETAVLIAGVTGIEPLIYVTQTLILLTWAFEEALVDVAAILQDKQVSVIKGGSEFLIAYSELVTLNRQRVQEKAKQIKEQVKGGMSYEEYLGALLLFNGEKSNLRCMNLINGNMRLCHDKEFSLEKCVYRFKLNAIMGAQRKFFFWQNNSILKRQEIVGTFQVTCEKNY